MQPAASRQYTANIPLPAKLNVSHGWPSHNRENSNSSSRLLHCEKAWQRTHCLSEHSLSANCLGRCNGCFHWSQAWTSWHERFWDVGKTYKEYGSYSSRFQHHEPPETTEAYISSLCQLAKNCNSGVLEDRLIRDQVVMGVGEDVVWEKFQDKKLDLTKCLEFGRAYNTSRQQYRSMSKSGNIGARGKNTVGSSHVLFFQI